MSHTEGLLATNHDRIESKDDHGWINDGWIIAQCQGPDAVANARRLVACWNYCEQLKTEYMEVSSATEDSDRSQKLLFAESERAKKAGQERDELLAALADTQRIFGKIPLSKESGKQWAKNVNILSRYLKSEMKEAK